MLAIQPPAKQLYSPHPLFNLGFRIFFSAAALYAIVVMVLWGLAFFGKTNMDMTQVPPFYWHGHEMLYGYTMAVIAGFLLTAVKTWTGIMMPYGYRLMGIFGCWLMARLCWLWVGIGGVDAAVLLSAAAVFDMAFMAWMCYAIIKAVLAVKQYKQMGIIAKLLLLTFGNALCYWAVLTAHEAALRIGVYLGLYLIIGVVLTIGRRVIPFFIERGIAYDGDKDISVKNSLALDKLSLVCFLIFMLVDIFWQNRIAVTISALSVAVVNGVRLMGWYHRGIWQKPLLWSLYLAFMGMCISFVLYAVQPWLGFSHSIAVHSLTLSAIGMMTLAMMSRVSLGHTGRSIHQPPKLLRVMFILMVITWLTRVAAPLIDMNLYMTWLVMAQLGWIGCFVLFCYAYLPILSAPRHDKLFG